MTEILARGLQNRGHDVVIFGYPGKMLENRMRGIAPFMPILKGMDFNPAVLPRVDRELRRYRPDVAMMLMKKDVTMTGVMASLRKVPIVVRHANQRPLGRGLYWKQLYGNMPALHVTNAEATKRTLLESAPWLEDSTIRVIYNGIDPDPYETALREDLGLPSGTPVAGFIGSFEARKGVRELAEAWHRVAAAVSDAHLLLVGQGSQESEMRRLLGNAPRVHWLGYRPNVAGILKSLDVVVLPSYVEGAPNIVLEAMSAGTAVLATAVSGTPELVRDDVEARLIEPRSVDAIVAGLTEMLSDKNKRDRFAAAARDRVQNQFGLDRMIDEYEEALGGLI